MSAESGVPTFRGEKGLWRGYRPEQLASVRAFRRNPEVVWQWYDWRRGIVAYCEPNAAHNTLAAMEEVLCDFTLITQNVDGLHQAAGSVNVLELHGNIWRVRCTECTHFSEDRRVPFPEIPPLCPQCNALLRPDVVWFGESLAEHVLEAAWAAAARCGTMLVIGTSAVVYPAASLPLEAARSGARLIEINPVPTPLSEHADVVVREPAARALPDWWQAHRPT